MCLPLRAARGDLHNRRFLPSLSDGWSASLHSRHAGREQADDLVMMFTGSMGKRKIGLALFANLSPCGGVSDSYLVCFSPDPPDRRYAVGPARQGAGSRDMSAVSGRSVW